MNIRRLENLDIAGKRVLVRVDYNVPLKGGRVEDDTRIRETLPTLDYLAKQNAKIILLAHLGRPKGKKDPRYSLRPVAEAFKKISAIPISFCGELIGPEAEQAVAQLKPGSAMLMENLRFYPGEEGNDPVFAKSLAKLGDVFVQDAFGALHRAHASTDLLPKLLPSAAGFLVQKEVRYLGQAMTSPARPCVAIIGGSKVSDKLEVLNRLIEIVDALLVGGAMAYTFLASQGVAVGNSLLEKDLIGDAGSILKKAAERKVRFLLPVDHRVTTDIKGGSGYKDTADSAIADGFAGVDIGSKTLKLFTDEIDKAKTVFWNGPVGIFEVDAFARGSLGIARALARATEKGAVTIAGGGDSLSALKKAGLSGEITHASTGGGASLEFIEGKTLPGLAALAV